MIKTLRDFPAIEELLQEPTIAANLKKLPRPVAAEVIKSAVAAMKHNLAETKTPLSRKSLMTEIKSRLEVVALSQLRRVINGTGTVIHTNLGRAPLSPKLLGSISETVSGYSNLEFDLATGRRGQRGLACEQFLAQLSGAQSAAVVNNCAAALFIIVNTFANRRPVVVSRGELVQIGGGFRIPDILRRAGGKLTEVGTTNMTSKADYESALEKPAGIILKVHKSNFAQSGFTSEVDITQLVSLTRESGTLVVNDLGSGGFVSTRSLLGYDEPTVQQSVRAGADITCFSGDKLLGGMQAGLIVGRSELIAKLKKNPLFRALRVDKVLFATLERLLRSYLDGSHVTDVPLWSILQVSESELYGRAQRLRRKLGKPSCISVSGTRAFVGGGALPEAELPSVALVFSHELSANKLMKKFRHLDPAIVGRIEDDKFLIDLKAIDEDDYASLGDGIRTILTELSVNLE